MVRSPSKVYPVKENGYAIKVEIPGETTLYDMKFGSVPFGVYLTVGSTGTIITEETAAILIKQLKAAIKEAKKISEEI